MRYDAAFLIRRDDERRKSGRTADGLEIGQLGLQCVSRSSADVVVGNIDTPDQSFCGQRRDLVERCIADDEVPSQIPRLTCFRAQHGLLAQLK